MIAMKPAQTARFLARVDVLGGSEVDIQGRRYGEVALSIILGDDEIVRARAILDPQQYAVANEAHMQNRYVVVTGIHTRQAESAIDCARRDRLRTHRGAIAYFPCAADDLIPRQVAESQPYFAERGSNGRSGHALLRGRSLRAGLPLLEIF